MDFVSAAAGRTSRARRRTVLRVLDRAGKRGLDVSLSALLLVLLLPLIVVIAVVVKLESPGPVLFRCRRVGYRGRELSVLKFRKMHEHAAGIRLSLGDDDRFTRVGRFLARSKLDELPQLISVLKGDMSLVGPRPEDACFVELDRAGFSRVLSVRPGITGLSQLAFAKEGDILDQDAPVDHYVARILPQKIALDSFYAEKRTLAMDIRVLLWTCIAVICRRDVAVHRSTARLTLRGPRPPQLAPLDNRLNGHLGSQPAVARNAD